jgi:hypothetical protein
MSKSQTLYTIIGLVIVATLILGLLAPLFSR